MNAPLKKPAARAGGGGEKPIDWELLGAKAQEAGGGGGGGGGGDEVPLDEPPVDDEEGLNEPAPAGGLDDPGDEMGGEQEPADMGGGGGGGGGAPASGGSSAASSNFPPVGDIKLSKTKGTFNTYKLELSYGQIECLRQALEKDHSNPIADELKTMFDYYISTVPGPGEEEEDVKARAESNAIGQKVGQPEDDDDMGLPMPPNEEPEAGTTVAGEGPEMGGPEEGPEMEGPPAEVESRLPAPPRE